MDNKSCILLCKCKNRDFVNKEKIGKIRRLAEDSGADVVCADDLCSLTVHKRDSLEYLADYDEIIVVACFERGVRNLLNYADPSIKISTVINMRNTEPEKIQFEGSVNMHKPVTKELVSDSEEGWFPVIDYSRCTNCMQCLNFCIFSVYSKDDGGRVKVQNPQNCKNNCPACARICPVAAIIFPKLDEEPYNGAEITDEEVLKDKIRDNTDKILGDDIYKALEERKKKARKLLLKKRAYEEREHCSSENK